MPVAVLAALLVAAVAGCGSGPAPAAPAADVADTGGGAVRCVSGTLGIDLGPGDSTGVALRFTNTGSRPCVIQGFPRAYYVPADQGRQVGREAQRDGAPGTPVTLAPGETASAALRLDPIGSYDQTVCRPTPSRGLQVYPPDDNTTVFVARPATVCAGTLPTPQLGISSVRPGGR